MPRATITSKGQMTIPKEIREHLNLRAGDRVDFVVRGSGEVLIRPAVYDLEDLEGLLYRKDGPVFTVEEMNEALRQRFERQ